jgi:hypothetical protein
VDAGREFRQRCAGLGAIGVDIEQERDQGVRVHAIRRDVPFPAADDIRGIERCLEGGWASLSTTVLELGHRRSCSLAMRSPEVKPETNCNFKCE